MEKNNSKNYLVYTNNFNKLNLTSNNLLSLNTNNSVDDDLLQMLISQINNNTEILNRIFIMKCPIARGHGIKFTENKIVTDYLCELYQNNPSRVISLIKTNVGSINELKEYLKDNCENIKNKLNFKITVGQSEGYSTTNKSSSSILPYGIYETRTLKQNPRPVDPNTINKSTSYFYLVNRTDQTGGGNIRRYIINYS